MIGKRLTEAFPGVKEFGLFAVLQRVWQTGDPEFFPASRYQDDRLVGWRTNYVYKLPSGEIVAVYDDITEQKQAEAELRHAKEEAETANRALQEQHRYIEEQNRQLKELNASKDKFFSITVTSEVDTGTTFLVTLPKFRQDDE